jgi:hypothetical protein
VQQRPCIDAGATPTAPRVTIPQWVSSDPTQTKRREEVHAVIDSLSLDSSTSTTRASAKKAAAGEAARQRPASPVTISLDDAAQVDEGRRTSAMTNLYEALLFTLPVEDQRWVLDVVARHRQAEREAEARGETLAGPAW